MASSAFTPVGFATDLRPILKFVAVVQVEVSQKISLDRSRLACSKTVTAITADEQVSDVRGISVPSMSDSKRKDIDIGTSAAGLSWIVWRLANIERLVVPDPLVLVGKSEMALRK